MIESFIPSIKRNREEQKKYRLQAALTLLILFVSASLANIIFIREVSRLKLDAGGIDNVISKPILDQFLATGIYSIVTGAIIIFIGLWVSSRANLGAPLFVRLFAKKPIGDLINWRSLLAGVVLAIAAAALLLGLFELRKLLYPVAPLQERPSKLYYLLVSFVAGINEEIVFRLGLMSLLVTAIQYFRKLYEPTNRIVWIGIILSALIFGVMHFPITSNFFELTPLSVAVTMLGNLITGTIFGWIFWRQGLLAAIISHIAFDITFHVIGSPFG